MKHGSLFSGIGGFDLAAKWMGWDNMFHVERDPFCQQVLRHHFPKSESHEDIKEFDGTAYSGRVDIISGGFPCQPFSAAGKRQGTSDDRYLWPQMFRVIREVGPTYVVAENVRGLISWNEGMVLDTVCADLEGEGYEVLPVVLPAASVNAPHRRDRVWIVAWNTASARKPKERKIQKGSDLNAKRVCADATNANSKLLRNRDSKREAQRSTESPYATEPLCGPTSWETFPTVGAVCGGDNGLSQRLDGITFRKWRRESIKAYGNAIVPQVALQIFRAIEQDVQSRI